MTKLSIEDDKLLEGAIKVFDISNLDHALKFIIETKNTKIELLEKMNAALQESLEK